MEQPVVHKLKGHFLSRILIKLIMRQVEYVVARTVPYMIELL